MFEYKSALITYINPYTYLYMRKKLELFKYFHLIFVDSFYLAKLLKLLGMGNIHRFSFDMSSHACDVFNFLNSNQYSVYIIGSTDESINSFIKKVKNEYSHINIIGYRHGYFNSIFEKEAIINHLSQVKPQVVIVGMGKILQEEFLSELKNTGWKGIGFTCGGFIHQAAKRLDYYPVFFDKYNLRWIYRILKEPKLIIRYSLFYLYFFIVFIYDSFKWIFC